MTVKIFVSSLFKEMAIERDVLHRQVSALLADTLSGEGTDLSFIDFRWGLDDSGILTASEKSEFIVGKCFEAIDDSDLFLALIGSEYGSLAEPEISARMLEGADPERSYSYTDLELEYARATMPRDRILFIHTPVSNNDDAEIVRIKHEFCKEYPSASYEKREGAVDPAFISGCVSLIGAAVSRLDGGGSRTEGYFARDALMERCTELGERERFVLLTGGSGSGKSVILRMLAEKYKEEAQGGTLTVHSIFDISSMRADLHSALAEFLGKDAPYKELLALLAERVAAADGRTVIILDSIDDFDINDIYALYEAVLPLSADKICCFMASARQKMYEYFGDLAVARLEVEALTPDETRGFLGYMAARYNKQYYPEIFDYIAERGGNFSNPLYLSMLMNRLITLDSDTYISARGYSVYTEGIVEEMKRVVDSCPERLEDIISWNLADLDKFIYPRFTSFLFTVMSVYGRPIPVSLVKSVYADMFDKEWSELDYYTYRYYLREFCDTEDDRLCFKHDIIAYCIRNRLTDATDIPEYRAALLRALRGGAYRDREAESYFAILLADPGVLDAIEYGADAEPVIRGFLRAAEDEMCGVCDGAASRLFDRIIATGDEELVHVFLARTVWSGTAGNLAAAFKLYTGLFGAVSESRLSHICKIRAVGVILNFVNSTGLENHAYELPVRFLRYTSELEDRDARLMAAELSETAYIATRVARSTDQVARIPRLLGLTYKYFGFTDELVFSAPLVVEIFEEYDRARAKELCLSLIEKHSAREDLSDPERAILGNLYYRMFSVFLNERNIEEADKYALLAYDTFLRIFEEYGHSSKAMYDYSLGLSAYTFHLSVVHDREEERRTFERLWSVRNHLCKVEPDSFPLLSSMTNTVLSICMNGIEISVPYTEMIGTVCEYMFRYARRGNARVGWLFAHFFKEAVKLKDTNTAVMELMLEKFTDIDIMLDPIIKQNAGNSEYLAEIIGVYLEIYLEYCNALILPIEKGQHLLNKLIGAARRMVNTDPSRTSYDLYFRVYLEIHTTLMQQMQNKMMITEHPLSLENERFLEGLEAHRDVGGEELALFLCLKPCLEILTYVFIMQDISGMDGMQQMLFKYALSAAGVNVVSELKKNALAIYGVIGGIENCEHHAVNIMFVALQLILKEDGAARFDERIAAALEYMSKRLGKNR